jgi:hypothetical protein
MAASAGWDDVVNKVIEVELDGAVEIFDLPSTS